MEEKKFDFNKVADAKEFLYGLWVGNRRVEGVQLPSGWLDFVAMTDEQLMFYATEIMTEWFDKPGSEMEWRPELLN